MNTNLRNVGRWKVGAISFQTLLVSTPINYSESCQLVLLPLLLFRTSDATREPVRLHCILSRNSSSPVFFNFYIRRYSNGNLRIVSSKSWQNPNCTIFKKRKVHVRASMVKYFLVHFKSETCTYLHILRKIFYLKPGDWRGENDCVVQWFSLRLTCLDRNILYVSRTSTKRPNSKYMKSRAIYNPSRRSSCLTNLRHHYLLFSTWYQLQIQPYDLALFCNSWKALKLSYLG